MVNEIHSNSQKVTDRMKNAKKIVEQSTANLYNVSSFVEEQNMTMEEVSSSAELLSQMAEDLHKAVSYFKA